MFDDIQTVNDIRYTMMCGDPMDPDGMDIMGCLGWVDIGKPVPDGWAIMSTYSDRSMVGRVMRRDQIEVYSKLEDVQRLEEACQDEDRHPPQP
jgi:hypothetical protein